MIITKCVTLRCKVLDIFRVTHKSTHFQHKARTSQTHLMLGLSVLYGLVILWTWSCQHRLKIVHFTEWVSSPLLAGASDWLAAWKCCGYVWSQSSWWRLQGIISSESFNISSIFINIFFRRNTETVLSDTDIVDAIQGKIRSNSKEKDGRARLLDLLKTEGTDMLKLDRSKMFWLT